jgi:hypothetical protein
MRFLSVLLLVGVAACGSDESDGTSSTTGSGGGETTASSSSAATGSSSSAQTTGTGAVCEGTCVPAAPAGWEGPFEVFAGTGQAPECDPGYSLDADGFADLVQPAGTCGCDCGTPSGLTCGNVQVDVSTTFTCSNAFDLTLTPNACMTNPPLSVGWWFDANGSAAQGGECNPSVTPMLDAAAFSTSVRVCGLEAPATAGCEGDAVCAPPRAAGAKMCVAQDGDIACPAGYEDRTVSYDGFVDSRACPDASLCSCTPEASCGGTVKTYVSTDCSGPSFTYTSLDFALCVEVQSPLDGVAPESILATATATGTCESAGDLAPTGTVTPDVPRTICCAP